MPEENQNVEVSQNGTTQNVTVTSQTLQTPVEPVNSIGTVAMWFSIIWLLTFVSIFLLWLWLPLLLLWLILWIIGLFYKPRGKARVAVCIPLVVFIGSIAAVTYVWSSIKTPTTEFITRIKSEFKQFEDDENFDNVTYRGLVKKEISLRIDDKTDEELKAMIDASTGSNIIEKSSYLIFSILQESMEAAMEQYNNGEFLELDIDDEDIDEEDIVIEEPKKEIKETFSQTEKNDIEQIIKILE